MRLWVYWQGRDGESIKYEVNKTVADSIRSIWTCLLAGIHTDKCIRSRSNEKSDILYKIIYIYINIYMYVCVSA